MQFRTASVNVLLAASLVALCVAASGQTATPQAPAGRAKGVVERRSEEEKEPTEPEDADEHPVERTIATDANVAVKVCVASGSITVHGWDRKEVRARSTEVADIEFQHDGEPAKKLQLLIADKPQGMGRTTSCLSFSDVEMDVPRGATVQLQTRDGDISVADVATAYVNTQNGDVSIEHASKAVDAGTIGGGITLKDSSGGINLHSVGGNIEASDVRPSEASDIFDASTVGGDIALEQVTHARLNARSLNGSLSMSGPLAHDGHYAFRTISGDVTLTLPGNSSFKISAKLSQTAEMITDFPLTLMSYSSASTSLLPKLPKMGPSPQPEAAPQPAAAPKSSATPSRPPTKQAPMAPLDDDLTPTPVPAAEPQSDPTQPIAKVKGIKTPRVVVEGYPLRRLEGICGSGDALIDVGSFSGTVHLKKQ